MTESKLVDDECMSCYVKPTVNPSFKWIDEGDSLFQSKFYEAAIKAYEEAIRFDPYCGRAYLGKGFSLYQLGLYDEARKALEQVTQLDFRNVKALIQQGNCLYKLQKYEESLEVFNRVIIMCPGDSMAYVYRGNAFYKLNLYKEALSAYEMALKLDSNNDLAKSNRSKAVTQLVTSLDSSALPVTDDFQRYFQKAHNLYVNRYHEEALEEYKRANALDPDHVQTYIEMGRTLLALKHYDAALEAFSKSHELDPKYLVTYLDRFNAWYDRVYVLYKLNRYEEALSIFQHVFENRRVKFSESMYPLVKFTGDHFYKNQQYEQALVAYDIFLSLSYNDTVNLTKADVLEHLGDYDQAHNIRRSVMFKTSKRKTFFSVERSDYDPGGYITY